MEKLLEALLYGLQEAFVQVLPGLLQLRRASLRH
jgi:hypothetical protein